MGALCKTLIFEDLFFCGLMVSLFIVYVIHIYVNLYCIHTFIHTVHTYTVHIYSNFILSGCSVGLDVLNCSFNGLRLSRATILLSTMIITEPRHWSYSQNIFTQVCLFLLKKKILSIINLYYYIYVLTQTLFCDFHNNNYF